MPWAWSLEMQEQLVLPVIQRQPWAWRQPQVMLLVCTHRAVLLPWICLLVVLQELPVVVVMVPWEWLVLLMTF